MLLPAAAKAGHGDGGKYVVRRARATARRAAPTEHDTRLAAVRDKLLQACGRCHDVWIAQLAASRAAAFKRRLQSHDWGAVVIEKQTWQRHEVDEETEAGQKVQSVVRLPSQASSYVVTLLCNVCADISRVGGHTVDPASIAALADTLFDRCAEAYSELLTRTQHGDGGSPAQAIVALSQDALLQILFDVYFLGDVLIGVVPPAGTPSARHAELARLVAGCKAGMDPFDLVIFLPLLSASRTKMFHRAATLLGYFTQLRAPPPGARPTLSSSEQSNTMAVAAVVNRFPLLPISAGGLKPGGRSFKSTRGGPSAALFAL